MMMSNRARRMAANHERHKVGKLNLVSLMDIFTILVFFLLVNSTEVAVLPNAKSMQIPESISEQKPHETVIVMVTETELLVQGERIASLGEIEAIQGTRIPALKTVLERLASQRRFATEPGAGAGEVTVMGHREIPYRLLRKVLATCGEADYGQISLAVVQKDTQPRS